ncbi:suppressor-of-stellate-like protein [Drosophila ficusphila]|uniref:suppressor-of-stellate-like protein n=1 Tax=Drosophila ficusphila TaxID=30025 RepID=UPI0007E73E4E|nr:suppressor-of-stellate-like protein [Drosophila ficusphila]
MSYHQLPNSVADGSWIGWFVGLQGNEFLCRVPADYVEDKFNLLGLEGLVENFPMAHELVLEPEFRHWDSGVDTTDAERLYGLIHARYILTQRGVEDMCLKYERGDFGSCPRFYCREQRVLPIGLSDQCGQAHVKVYCPQCTDVFQPRSRCALLDGAMFGTGFPHMFFMQLPDLRPDPPKEKYVARLYGFQIHHKTLCPSESPERESKHSESPAGKPTFGALPTSKASLLPPRCSLKSLHL